MTSDNAVLYKKISYIYARRVKRGDITIDKCPEELQEEVREIIDRGLV